MVSPWELGMNCERALQPLEPPRGGPGPAEQGVLLMPGLGVTMGVAVAWGQFCPKRLCAASPEFSHQNREFPGFGDLGFM
jgi:hypothetical protein